MTQMRLLAMSLFLATALTACLGGKQATSFRDDFDAYLKTRGPQADETKIQIFKADMNGDGKDDSVVSYYVDQNLSGGSNAGAQNPANLYGEFVVFIQKKDRWTVVATEKMGQGKVKQVKDGAILVEEVTYGPEDPLCCPSVKTSKTYRLDHGKLVLAP